MQLGAMHYAPANRTRDTFIRVDNRRRKPFSASSGKFEKQATRSRIDEKIFTDKASMQRSVWATQIQRVLLTNPKEPASICVNVNSEKA